MKKYQCSVCGYVYDEAKGDASRGIPPGTKWEDLPSDWSCPDCGAVKEEFREMAESPVVSESPSPRHIEDDTASAMHGSSEQVENMHKLSAPELAVICTNLEKACRKMNRGWGGKDSTDLKVFSYSFQPGQSGDTTTYRDAQGKTAGTAKQSGGTNGTER